MKGWWLKRGCADDCVGTEGPETQYEGCHGGTATTRYVIGRRILHRAVSHSFQFMGDSDQSTATDGHGPKRKAPGSIGVIGSFA